MTRPHIPQDVLDAAHARRSARHARAWAEADRLKALIEAAGWRVVDRGGDFALFPLHPADVVEGDRTRHGWSGAVPSRLGEADAGPATVVARARDLAGLAGARSLLDGAPAGTRLVVVVDADDEAALAVLAQVGQAAEPGVEAVWLAGPGGLGAAWNAGLRRATGAVVVLAGDGVQAPGGDAISPLLAALDDPAVAVAGARALIGPAIHDLAPSGDAGPVPALDDTLLAFRRADASALGPLDERYATPGLLAAWWSLTLRDGELGSRDDGEDEAREDVSGDAASTADAAPVAPAPPRHAIAVAGLPLGHASGAHTPGPQGEGTDAERRIKRDRYRLLDAFGDRPDLLGPHAG